MTERAILRKCLKAELQFYRADDPDLRAAYSMEALKYRELAASVRWINATKKRNNPTMRITLSLR